MAVARHFHNNFRIADFDVLGDWDLSKVVKVGDCIPGYRYSATFFSTLRSNIHLSTDLSSLPSTPTMPTFQSSSLLRPSPLSMPPATYSSQPSPPTGTPSSPQSTSDPLPTLATFAATSPTDRTAALRLIADSIAQQRQQAAYSLLTHPYTLSPYLLLLAILFRLLDFAVFTTTTVGITMIALLAVRTATQPYIKRAESDVNQAWLESASTPPLAPFASSTHHHHHEKSNSARHSRTSSTSSNYSSGSGNVAPAVTQEDLATGRKRGGSRGDETVVLVTRWGEDIIGALVIRCPRREKKAYLRAWTVVNRYRGKGVGRGLLEEGVKFVWGRGVRGLEVEGGNIYSQKVLPEIFNKGMEEQDAKVREILEDVVVAQRRGKN
ncbi:MAG: hypothetical protein Q9190_003225 [Brigantiaea leucoxantha]